MRGEAALGPAPRHIAYNNVEDGLCQNVVTLNLYIIYVFNIYFLGDKLFNSHSPLEDRAPL